MCKRGRGFGVALPVKRMLLAAGRSAGEEGCGVKRGGARPTSKVWRLALRREWRRRRSVVRKEKQERTRMVKRECGTARGSV